MSGARNRVCSVCGTKRFQLTEDGGMTCRYGHQVLGWQEECDEEFGQVGYQRKKAATGVKAHHGKSRVYGTELRSVHYRIFQHSLQKLALTFVHDLGFPIEFEYVVRELWLLYANDSKLYLTDEINLVNVDESKRKLMAAIQDDINCISDKEDSDENEDDYDKADDDDNDSDGSNIDINSKKDRHSYEQKEKELKRKRTFLAKEQLKGVKRTKDIVWPELRFRHMLCFCYLACVWLRWPVLMSDITRWCETMRLPYMFIFRELPDEIISLVDVNKLKMSMLVVPTVTCLSKDVFRFGSLFNLRCKLTFPLVNTPLLIYRLSNQFCLPVEMYFVAIHISEKLGFDGRINGLIEEYARPRRAQGSGDMLAVISVLITIKLTYGLDDDKRDVLLPRNNIVPLMPKNTWVKLIKEKAKIWEDTCTKKSIKDPDVDLNVLLYFLMGDEDTTDNSASTKSLENEPITRATRDMGENYQRVYYDYKARPKLVHTKEYELVIKLAANILGVKPISVHSAIVMYERILFGTQS
ncbi:hypothetical protein J3Q64DRAFT_1091975 [Phycomyces blakesleeanus]|uniref:RRN7-type domain-containing protein n=1 Tax=Phycomyces blakesleeanus TaxID=4837 RepID=A0ABR3BKT4_PHYBL